MRILITGAAGFVGRRLTRWLIDRGEEVIAVDSVAQADESGLPNVIRRVCDLTDRQSALEILCALSFDAVIHLAAVSSVRDSWENPERTYRVNVLGTVNVMEAAQRISNKVKVLIVSSGEVYGPAPPDAIPTSEEYPPRPISPYSASKLCAEIAALQFFFKDGAPVIIARSFNHTGVGQSSAFVAGDFARQIARMEAGLQEPEIHVGNLDVVRDISDVGDVIRAYYQLLQSGRSGETYNVCAGVGVSIRDLLNGLVSMSEVAVKVVRDPAKMRPADIPTLVGNPQKLRTETGWEARIPLDDTLGNILSYWRTRAR